MIQAQKFLSESLPSEVQQLGAAVNALKDQFIANWLGSVRSDPVFTLEQFYRFAEKVGVPKDKYVSSWFLGFCGNGCVIDLN